MKSIEEWLDGIKSDPVKVKRAFYFVWIVAYSMLILGFAIIIWVLLQEV